MNDLDENGWRPIHHAAFRGFLKSIESFIRASETLLELETMDELHSTPLLLAVMSGNIETVQCLLSLGGNIKAINSQGHGVVELAAMQQDAAMLRFFMHYDSSRNIEEIMTWKKLLALLLSPLSEEAENACACLRRLLTPWNISDLEEEDSENGRNRKSTNGNENVWEQSTEKLVQDYWNAALHVSLVQNLIKVVRSDAPEKVKVHAFLTLRSGLHLPEVRHELVTADGLTALVPLLRSETYLLVLLTTQVLGSMANISTANTHFMVQAGIISSLVKLLTKWSKVPVSEESHQLQYILHGNDQTSREGSGLVARNGDKDIFNEPIQNEVSLKEGDSPLLTKQQRDELLEYAIETLGIVCKDNEVHQLAAGREPNCLQILVSLYEDCFSKGLLMALTTTVRTLIKKCPTNQNAILEANMASNLVLLLRVKDSALQMAAVQCVHLMAKGNPASQKRLLAEGATLALLYLIRRNRASADVKEITAKCLWTLAGTSIDGKRRMALSLSVELLVEFLQGQSTKLHLIGAEGISVLAQGPDNHHETICRQGGVQGLVSLLRSEKEIIVLNALRALRYLCQGPAHEPRTRSQSLLIISRGVKFLVALLVYAKDESIRAEAACTLAAACLNNPAVMSEAFTHPEFTFIRVLKLMYSETPSVRLLAGTAVTTFAYNSVTRQKEIAQKGGVRFHTLLPFLRSSSEWERCEASFQVVILSRIIPDEEQSISSAAGIKLLIDLMSSTNDTELLSLCANYVGSLAHSRAGIPQAMIAIGAVDVLCNLLTHDSENVRGYASIALSYLTHNPEARRIVLNRSRHEPHLMNVIKQHHKSLRNSNPELWEGWRHMRRVGLPPIRKGKVQLTSRKATEEYFKDPGNRQLTMFSVDDDPIGSSRPPVNVMDLHQNSVDKTNELPTIRQTAEGDEEILSSTVGNREGNEMNMEKSKLNYLDAPTSNVPSEMSMPTGRPAKERTKVSFADEKNVVMASS